MDFPKIIIPIFTVLGMYMLTSTRMEAIRESYTLELHHKNRQRVQMEIARLEIEYNNLARPERIEELAKRIGMVYPDGK